MASNNEEQTEKVNLTSKEVQSEKPKTKNTPLPSKNKSIITPFAFLFALGALGTAAYTVLLNEELKNQLTDTKKQLSAQFLELEKKQGNTQEQIDTKINASEEIQDNLHNQIDNLSKELHNVMSQRFYQNQNWLLLKTRYCLELAQINAHWSKNFSATVALLQQADQLLQQLNDPKIFDIRQAIAKDVAQLEAMPSVNIAGILSQLDAAQSSINAISPPSIQPFDNQSGPEYNARQTDNLPAWRVQLQKSLNMLGQLVVIRRPDQNIKPPMSQLFEALLKENIRLNLQEAQWAVLNNNPFVYNLVLTQAISNLKKNFNEGAANTRALIKTLTELQQIQLTSKKPEIGLALPLLNELIAAKESQVNQNVNSEQGGKPQ